MAKVKKARNAGAHNISTPKHQKLREDWTAQEVGEILSYAPETGIFRWLRRYKKSSIGSVAGCKAPAGRKQRIIIRFDAYGHLAHRLAWLLMTGVWPKNEIDHIDGNPLNNTWKNLRIASRLENSYNRGLHKNSSTGLKGASFQSATQKYTSTIKAEGKNYFLGYFNTAEEAHEAYKKAAKQLHGAFASFDL